MNAPLHIDSRDEFGKRQSRKARADALPLTEAEPSVSARTVYAVEAFGGSTGLYSDPERTRFVAVIYRPLAEGEVIEGATYGLYHKVTWKDAA